MILDALDYGIISSLEFSKYTNLGQNQIPKLEEILFKGQWWLYHLINYSLNILSIFLNISIKNEELFSIREGKIKRLSRIFLRTHRKWIFSIYFSWHK